MGWVELEWKKEQLEQSVIKECKVVTLKERLTVLRNCVLCDPVMEQVLMRSLVHVN